MKIELTILQYKTLLKIMYCGEWVINSHKIKEDKVSKATENVEQTVFSYAEVAGLAKWILYDEDLKKYFPTADMENDLHSLVEKYDQMQKKRSKSNFDL